MTMTYADGSVAQLTSVWHQVLSRESSRRLEVFCERRYLWTEDDYLGPLHVETSEGAEVVASPLPEWAERLTVPEVYAKGVAAYATPSEGIPRRARGRWRHRGRAPVGGDGARRPSDRGRRLRVRGPRRGSRIARACRRIDR